MAKGYGQLTRQRVSQKAHRVAWEIINGIIPDDLFVLHKCDNPSCVNPNHLFLGTNQDNHNDMVAKDRHTKGERDAMHKLTLADVQNIRLRYSSGGISMESLGKESGVSTGQIFRIIRYINWKDD